MTTYSYLGSVSAAPTTLINAGGTSTFTMSLIDGLQAHDFAFFCCVGEEALGGTGNAGITPATDGWTNPTFGGTVTGFFQAARWKFLPATIPTTMDFTIKNNSAIGHTWLAPVCLLAFYRGIDNYAAAGVTARATGVSTSLNPLKGTDTNSLGNIPQFLLYLTCAFENNAAAADATVASTDPPTVRVTTRNSTSTISLLDEEFTDTSTGLYPTRNGITWNGLDPAYFNQALLSRLVPTTMSLSSPTTGGDHDAWGWTG